MQVMRRYVDLLKNSSTMNKSGVVFVLLLTIVWVVFYFDILHFLNQSNASTECALPTTLYDEAMQGKCSPESSNFVYIAYGDGQTFLQEENFRSVLSLRASFENHRSKFVDITVVIDSKWVIVCFVVFVALDSSFLG